MLLRLVNYCAVFKLSDMLADTGKNIKTKKEEINYNIGHTQSKHNAGFRL